MQDEARVDPLFERLLDDLEDLVSWMKSCGTQACEQPDAEAVAWLNKLRLAPSTTAQNNS